MGNYKQENDIVKFEQQQIERSYELGVISLEERNKLLDDITPELWELLVWPMN